MNYDDFESFLLLLIELLTPSNFLNELLNDNFIVIVSFARGNFNMVITWKYNTLNVGAAAGAGFEFFKLTFYFVNRICIV